MDDILLITTATPFDLARAASAESETVVVFPPDVTSADPIAAAAGLVLSQAGSIDAFALEHRLHDQDQVGDVELFGFASVTVLRMPSGLLAAVHVPLATLVERASTTTMRSILGRILPGDPPEKMNAPCRKVIAGRRCGYYNEIASLASPLECQNPRMPRHWILL